MDKTLTKSFVARLPEQAIIALEGDARFVHPFTGITQWHFARLRSVDGADIISVDQPGEAAQLGELLTVIAMSDDGDALIIRDDQNMTLMYWYHDNHHTEKLPCGIGQWIDAARRIDVESAKDERSSVSMPIQLIGCWSPVKILTRGMKGHFKTVPSIEIFQDGRWLEHYRWPRKMTRQNQVVRVEKKEEYLDLHESDQINRYWFKFESDDQLVISGPDIEYRVAYERVVEDT